MGIFSNLRKYSDDEGNDIDDVDSWLNDDVDEAGDNVDIGASLGTTMPPPPSAADQLVERRSDPPQSVADALQSQASPNTELWNFPDVDDDVGTDDEFGGLSPAVDLSTPPAFGGDASFDPSQPFDAPSLDAPSLETPSLETPSLEIPSFDAPSTEGLPAGFGTFNPPEDEVDAAPAIPDPAIDDDVRWDVDTVAYEPEIPAALQPSQLDVPTPPPMPEFGLPVSADTTVETEAAVAQDVAPEGGSFSLSNMFGGRKKSDDAADGFADLRESSPDDPFGDNIGLDNAVAFDPTPTKKMPLTPMPAPPGPSETVFPAADVPETELPDIPVPDAEFSELAMENENWGTDTLAELPEGLGAGTVLPEADVAEGAQPESAWAREASHRLENTSTAFDSEEIALDEEATEHEIDAQLDRDPSPVPPINAPSAPAMVIDLDGSFAPSLADLQMPQTPQATVLLEILGLDGSATWDEARSARRALITEHDPDAETDEERAALARAIRREMNTAYAALRLLQVP